MNVQPRPPVPPTTRRQFVLLNRIRSAILQMKLYENELVYVGVELKDGSLTPDEAEKLLEDMGATPLLNAAVGLQ